MAQAIVNGFAKPPPNYNVRRSRIEKVWSAGFTAPSALFDLDHYLPCESCSALKNWLNLEALAPLAPFSVIFYIAATLGFGLSGPDFITPVKEDVFMIKGHRVDIIDIIYIESTDSSSGWDVDSSLTPLCVEDIVLHCD
ncbi:hypothetical protein BGX27_008697 [Mortierella sp. AM989]|nr:hypothetical protein BGX27_008697 [Mortierella sp. AM989]